MLVFALCFADYEVASLLQVVTYPVEVFLLYAGMFSPGEAARACLPLLAVACVTATVLALGLGSGMARQWPSRVLGEWPLPRWQARGLLALVLLWVAGFVAWPALGLVSQLEATQSSWQGLRAGAPALANSLATTLAAVLLALAFGGMAAGALVRARAATRTALVAALLIPLCLPGPAFGIAWVELLSRWPSSLRVLLAALPALAPALCIAARWAGLVAVLVAAARLALPQSALDAARLQEGNALRRALRIELPLIRPMLLAATAVVASLAHSATGTLVLTVPAGFEVAPLRIDNLLHYGARDQAVALAIATALIAAGIPLVLALSASRFWRNAR
jgi:ABC-type Fe3+ transport system permease subunit